METRTQDRRIINPSMVDDYIPTVIDDFLKDRHVQGLSPKTIRFYRDKLNLFAAFMEGQEIKQLSQLDKNAVRLFLLWLEEHGHNPGGRHAHYRAVKAFLRWWDNEAEPDDWRNPIQGIRGPRVDIPPLKPIPTSVVLALLKTCGNDRLLDVRDRAVILALLDTGARAGEFCRMDISEVDYITGGIVVAKTKNRNPRQVFISRKTRQAIKRYIKLRHDSNVALWISKNAERLEVDTLRGILLDRARKAGEQPYSPHSFRRAWALAMLRAGTDVFTLQRLGGWRSMQVMRRYLDEDDTDTRRAHEQGSPVDRLAIRD